MQLFASTWTLREDSIPLGARLLGGYLFQLHQDFGEACKDGSRALASNKCG